MNDVIPTRQAPALALGDTLMKLIADPNVHADKLQLLLTMQKEIMADSRREEFNAAFAAMAPKMPKIDKRGLVELIKDGKKFGSYNYAKYEDMDDLIRPILNAHGFSLTFYPGVEDGKPVLYGELLHSAGHSKRGFLPLVQDKGPGRNDIQAEGSGLSYQKRYLAELLCNIVRKGVDDDGIAAMTARINQDQVTTLINLLSDTKTKPETFLQMMVTEATKLEEIPQRDFARLKNVLEAKVRSLAKAAKDKPSGKK
jgi:hypothetical protein